MLKHRQSTKITQNCPRCIAVPSGWLLAWLNADDGARRCCTTTLAGDAARKARLLARLEVLIEHIQRLAFLPIVLDDTAAAADDLASLALLVNLAKPRPLA